ncbi:MAG: patatin-like phospholipase family protein [Anaerolineales bacterium]
MYKVLSIDGGGIRGVIPVRIMERLEKQRPGIVQEFDLFAGTSTGAVLAGGFAFGLTARFMRQMYQGFGEEVFADSLWDDIRDLKYILGADYSIDHLKDLLERVIGETKLGQLSKKVLIAAFDLKDEKRNPPRWKPKFFNNFEGPHGDKDERLVDVVIRSAAAPVYFPVYQGYVDGGVAAINPSTCALAQAFHEGFLDVRLLSLGTGNNPRWLEVQNENWGLAQWGLNLVNIFMDGGGEVADYQCRQILGDQYYRLQPRLGTQIGLDQWQATDQLIAVADEINLEPLINWIDKSL